MIIGYTAGTFDLFHVGHLNLLRNASGLCDKLIVAVSVDSLVAHKCPIVPFEQRIEIVRAIKYVDLAIPQISMDKYAAWERIGFDIAFVGDDWHDTEMWNGFAEKFGDDVRIVYLPYTWHMSSTLVKEKLVGEWGNAVTGMD